MHRAKLIIGECLHKIENHPKTNKERKPNYEFAALFTNEITGIKNKNQPQLICFKPNQQQRNNQVNCGGKNCRRNTF